MTARSVRTGKAKKTSWGSGNVVRSLEHGHMDKRVEGKAPYTTHTLQKTPRMLA